MRHSQDKGKRQRMEESAARSKKKHAYKSKIANLGKGRKQPTLPLFNSGDPDLAKKAEEMFGSAKQIKEPRIRKDGVCARKGCTNQVVIKRNPAVSAAFKDPFCSSRCARIYYGIAQ